ncbi:MAG TPA: hypothetical protein VJR06_08990, partial [Nitrososphaerales archaeon]|nr:hypothetical protein [Nitrososphaerales archaeon]
GGLKINTTSSAATLIDIQPTVVNLGSESQPSFTMAAGAQALQMPPSEVDTSTHEVGHKTSLGGHDWYTTFESKRPNNLTISGLALSPNSLSFSATNGGSDAIAVRAIMIAPFQNGGGEGAALGSVMNGAAFVAQSDGSLTLLSGGSGQAEGFLEGSGYSLAPGFTQQFAYSGAITNIFGNKGIAAGTSYYVLVVGPGTLSVETVIAS